MKHELGQVFPVSDSIRHRHSIAFHTLGSVGNASKPWMREAGLRLGRRWLPGMVLLTLVAWSGLARGQKDAGADGAPIPDIRQLMVEVMKHQRAMDSVRENYTYRADVVTEELDSSGKVTKNGTEEMNVFYVNSHRIERTVKRDGKPLSGHDLDKETERITKLVEKAQKVPPGQPLEGPNTTVSITQLLDIMQVSNPRRTNFRGRSTIVFDFAGRHDAKTHGLVEDASKRIAGTLWVDEKDRQVARMEARFTDNFHIGAGLLANIQKGSSFYFDQGLINGEIWLPTGGEFRVQARMLLVKAVREHVSEQDSDYEQFSVRSETGKTATVVEPKK